MTTSSPIDSNTPSTEDTSAWRQAFEAVRPDLARFSPDDLTHINIDVPAVVKTVRGAVENIKPHKAQAATIPWFDATLFDNLEMYANALAYAHAQYRAATAPPERIDELVQGLTSMRELLLSDLQALSFRGIVDAAALAQVKRGGTQNSLAHDVVLLASLARRALSSSAARTLLTLEEIVGAEQLGDQLVKALGVKEQTKQVATVENDHRKRAYTLLVRSYNEVRRVISFLRWHDGDAEDIAPSLHTAGRAARRGDEEVAAEPEPAAAPTGPVAVQGANPAVAAPTPTSTGLPGEDPLVR